MYIDFYCLHMLFPTPLGFVSINKAPDTHTHTHISDRGEREMSPKRVDRCAYKYIIYYTVYMTRYIHARLSYYV